jgi:hypothetical protein
MVFCFIQKIFPKQHESYNIYFFVAQSAIFFSPKFNIRLYDKNSDRYVHFLSDYVYRQYYKITDTDCYMYL